MDMIEGAMIPNSYQPAEWRNTTPVSEKTGRIGIGFNTDEGRVIRLSLAEASARQLLASLADYLDADHSPKSSGMPSVEVSIPLEGENV